jgi:hypothetical protein
LKTKIAENISDPVIKFNKTPINTGSSGHLDIRKTPHQINVFFQSIKKKRKKKKANKQSIINFNIFRNKR